MKTKELMEREILYGRFDTVEVESLIRSWEVLAHTVLDFTIQYDCQEVTLPFDSFDEATVAFLLSEGNHPSDGMGMDYLFLSVWHLVGRYNAIVTRLVA